MRLVSLVALALSPIVLGTPVDSADDGRLAPAAMQTPSTVQLRVTADSLDCHSKPCIDSRVIKTYPKGKLVTGTCWTKGETIGLSP